jgi:catechol 2,3-dioxygenase-like lactoylglutathione lyase family enzyme
MNEPLSMGAVLIVSRDAPRLAWFYRDALGLPLRDESHADAPGLHFGCQLGQVHFAVHPPENFPLAPESGSGGVRFALNVDDIASWTRRLEERGVELLFGPLDLGWSQMLGFRDPDGNYVELVQLRR